MRAIILAITASCAILLFTVFGSIGYCNILDNLVHLVENTGGESDAEYAEEYFSRWEFFLSLGVSDATLDSIEISLKELASIDGSNTAYESTKSRLLCEITQLRRLLGFNFKAIF